MPDTLWSLIQGVPHHRFETTSSWRICLPDCMRCRLERWARERAKEWQAIPPGRVECEEVLGVPQEAPAGKREES